MRPRPGETSRKPWRVAPAALIVVAAYVGFILTDRWMRSVQQERYAAALDGRSTTIARYVDAVTERGMTPAEYIQATSGLQRRSSESWHAPWHRLVHRRRIDLPWTTLDPVIDAEFINGRLERVDHSGYLASDDEVIDSDSAARLM